MRKSLQSTIVIILLFILSCTKLDNDNKVNDSFSSPSLFNPTYSLDNLEESKLFNDGVPNGTVNYINEASGIVTSNYNNGMIWSHNDGGNGSELFLMNAKNGEMKAKYHLEQSPNLDWEDVSISFSHNFSYTYIADIGDNFQMRNYYSLYCFEEPVYDSLPDANRTIQPKKIDFRYPDGSKNAEAIFVDPKTGDIIIATKGHSSSNIYRVSFSQLNTATGQIVVEKLGDLPIGSITGGDMSSDGNWLALRTYSDILFWSRDDNETISEMLDKAPQKLPYNQKEPQGEAFCWGDNGYFTLSERTTGMIPDLYFYSLK